MLTFGAFRPKKFTMTKREYNYIRIRKTITNAKLIREIKEIAEDKSLSDLEVCNLLIAEGASRTIIEKRKNTLSAFNK